MGENLVWNATVQVGSHHYAKLFLKQGDNIFWLSLPWTIFHLLTGIKNERMLQWHCSKSKEEQDGLLSYCPLTFLPYRDNMLFRNYRNAERSLKYSLPGLKTVLGKAGFDRVDVLWLDDPRMIGLLGIVEYNLLVYRCVDDLEFFKGIPQNIILLEKEIVKAADVVFATAKPLVQRLKKWRTEVHFLPNGVDFFHFYNFQGEEPEDIKEIPCPRVIYVGTLGEWFDTEVIEYAAKRRTNFSFILVGPIRREITALNKLKNVFVLVLRQLLFDGWQRKKHRYSCQIENVSIRQFKSGEALGIKDLGIGITVSDKNAKDLLPLFHLANAMNIEFAIAVVHNSYYFHKMDNEIEDKDMVAGEFRKLIREYLKTKKVKNWFRAYMATGIINRIYGIPRMLPCTMGTDSFFLDPLGEIRPCNVMDESMGNIKQQSFEEIWRGDRANKVREKVANCKENCWMIGSVSCVMRKKIWKPAWWIVRNKWLGGPYFKKIQNYKREEI